MWWQWLIFGLIILAAPYGLYEIKKFATKRIKPTEEQNKIANQRFTILCLFYWLCDCFYMTFIINNLIWKFILGGLIMVIIFYNLSKAFINGNSPLKFGLVQDFIVGIALTIYLIYIIPNESLQQIIIPIIAAVYGGLLTLVGVAWTIKKSDKDRKEEEVKKAKPLFDFSPILDEPIVVSGSKNCFPIDNEKGYTFDTHLLIDNSEHSSFKLKRIFHDQKWFELTSNTMVLSNKRLILSFKFNEPIDIFLEVEDALENLYYYKMELVNVGFLNGKTIKRHTVRSLKEIDINEIKIVENNNEGDKNE